MSAVPRVFSVHAVDLAIRSCFLSDQKEEPDLLSSSAMRAFGCLKLVKKVRSVLNKALYAEYNAGRLKTDWERVWKPRKK